MKILFFARRFYPLIGGVEKHCLLLGKELLKRGHQLTIITEWDYSEIKNEYAGESPKFIPEEEYGGTKVIRIPVTTNQKLKKWQIWLWFIKHQQLLKNCDLIHCHDVFYWFLPFRLLYPKKKVFLTFHGYEGNHPPNWRKRLSHQLADRLSQGNICIGDFQAKWYGVKPTFVSYGAVSIEGSMIQRIKETKIQKTMEYDLCYVGRLAEDVGITVYLEALKILKEKGLDLSMAICGDGPLMQPSKDYVRQESLRVEFLGFTNKALDVLVKSRVALISRYLGILEALLIGKPIVAVYDNQIKKDYLVMAPYAKWINIVDKPEDVADAITGYMDSHLQENKKEIRIDKSNDSGQARLDSARQARMTKIITEEGNLWAKEQTWGKMTDLYLKLWQYKSV